MTRHAAVSSDDPWRILLSHLGTFNLSMSMPRSCLKKHAKYKVQLFATTAWAILSSLESKSTYSAHLWMASASCSHLMSGSVNSVCGAKSQKCSAAPNIANQSHNISRKWEVQLVTLWYVMMWWYGSDMMDMAEYVTMATSQLNP